MITDKLINIDRYKCFPYVVLNFIKNLSPDITLGKHMLADGIYANVEEYNTKNINIAKYESHNEYIDIQILLSGQECIYYADVDVLNAGVPYDSEKDITFYADVVEGHNILLDGSNFVTLYPNEAHAPQLSLNNSKQFVKKVVIKVKKDLI